MTKDSDIAKAFNEHFKSLASTYPENVDIPAPGMSEQHNFILKKFVQSKLPPGNTFTIPPIREEWVQKTLTNLDKHKATGLDNISAKVLKATAPYIAKVISKLCNHSIKHITFPLAWETARVSPLHKKASIYNPYNYRPISILPVLSKILEKHVFNALLEFLTVNDLLFNRQSGFRSKHSGL